VLAEERSLYSLDADLNAHLAPDLILTQDVCQVCAVPSNEPALCSLGVEVAGYERQVVAAVAAAEVDTRVADQIVIAQGSEDVGVERQRRLLAVAAGVVLDVPGARGGTQLVTLRDQSRIVAAGADGISEGARS